MARQIKQEEETTTTQQATETAAKVSQTPVPATDDAKPDAYALSVLQAFPAYEKLYVDKYGGIYTPDTPESLRGMATLYKNPYFINP